MDKFIFALDNWTTGSTGNQTRPNGLRTDDPADYLIAANIVFNNYDAVTFLASNDVPPDTRYFYPIRIQTSEFFEKSKSPYYDRPLTISDRVLQDIKNNLCKIIFLYYLEGQNTTQSRDELLVKQAELLGIKLSSLIYIDANMYNSIYRDKNILSYFYNGWEYFHAPLQEQAVDSIKDSIKNKQSRSKKFVNFNRRAHLHRLFLTDMILGAGIEKDMILTMGAGPYKTPVPDPSSEILNDRKFDVFDERLQNVKKRMPITYDITDFYGNNPVDLNLKAHLDSYICITSETFFFRGRGHVNMFFSEKTFKPIVTLQPFIMVNYARSLENLRRLGYKTFHPYIDETYDLIEEGDARLHAIFNEIARLNRLSDEELKQMMVDLLPILEHNEQVYREHLRLNASGRMLLQDISKDWKGIQKVAMIGMGKLGKDCAEVMSTQHDVTGYDVTPVTSKTVKVKDTLEEAVKDRDIIFVAVPTPHDPAYGGEVPTSHLTPKDFDYTIVKNVLSDLYKVTTPDQLIVLISTVLPGTVRKQLIQLIPNRRFIYNPYLIAMGTIKQDMVNPEMVIIGTSNGETNIDSMQLIEFYKTIIFNKARIVHGTWDEAESIKIFYNTFISAKLALVNMVQDVAEKNGNINVDVVTNALKDSTYRIMGPAYMTAGMGDGGACHPRDNIALRYMAQELGLGYDLFDSIMFSREIQAENLALRCVREGSKVCIVGKAYKPDVPYTNGSYSLLVAHYIEKRGGKVTYYDPNTGDSTFDTKADVYLIGYWSWWVNEIDFPYGSVVIDPWRKNKEYDPRVKVIHYGNTR